MIARWWENALCATQEYRGLQWFPDEVGKAHTSAYRAAVVAARQVCALCPVQAECHAYATQQDTQAGVWAGVPYDSHRWD